MKNKICAKCKLPKILDDFSPNKKNADGKQSWCNQCNNIRIKNYRKKYPWKKTLIDIKTRCNKPKASNYKYYGAKGIKCLITEEELKVLWYRDKAWLLKQPSIDRINNNGDYEPYNCQYIEMKENAARQNKYILN